MYKEIIFYSASFLIMLFGVLTIYFKNIFYSLLSAICVFFLTAVIFWLLGSEYNAVVQLAVYGFAIPIILGLGIMFTSVNKQLHEHKTNMKYFLLFAGGLFILAVIYLTLISLAVVPDGFNTDYDLNNSINTYNNFRIFTKGIYVNYVYSFEIISLILTMTAAGLTILKKRKGDLK